ncbi:MAG: C40 family peptidase [Bacteroidia bacterium]|nr:C40 family peptidase [Bacteroidia bacterium]
MFGICRYSTVCVKREPSHTSELVTELLFNDIYETIENQDDWIKIRMEYDGYEGWISKKQHHEISEEEFKTFISKDKNVVCNPVEIHDGKILTFGTTILGKRSQNSDKANEMISNGLKLLDIPYRWGGRTVFGIDCSGFVQLCAKSVGIKLPRDASQQVKCGDDVYFLTESKPGDLAFFENEEHHIVHVGIIIEGEKILHASGKVRIDSLDQTGIFNKEAGRHTHFLAAIKRVIKQDVEK